MAHFILSGWKNIEHAVLLTALGVFLFGGFGLLNIIYKINNKIYLFREKYLLNFVVTFFNSLKECCS
jgi:hypothetical protein